MRENVASTVSSSRGAAHEPHRQKDSCLIVGLGGAVPESDFESFIELGSLHVMDGELARSLAPSAGLRNRLVHEYVSVDDSTIYDSVIQAMRLYTEYVRSIKNYLDLK